MGTANIFGRCMVICSYLIVPFLCARARAEPYELVARYAPRNSGSPVEVRVDDKDVLTRETAEHELEGIYLRGKTDDYSRHSHQHAKLRAGARMSVDRVSSSSDITARLWSESASSTVP